MNLSKNAQDLLDSQKNGMIEQFTSALTGRYIKAMIELIDKGYAQLVKTDPYRSDYSLMTNEAAEEFKKN